MAIGLRATTARQRACAEPIYVAAADGLAVVCDARFDNLDELHRSLELPLGTRSDAELVAQAYRRWSTDAAAHLDGDFAFVVWDAQRRRVFAARDRFGARSLHFRLGGGALVIATEPSQILEDPGTTRDLDSRMILDHLTWQYAHHRLTFFRAIHRVEPGHALLATEDQQRQIRYWHPPLGLSPPGSLLEYADEFSTIFRKAVVERLASPTPVALHLSGGLDSSSIVCVANDERNMNHAPSIVALAAKFPGLDCDESEFIAAVDAETRIPVRTWNGAPVEPSWDELAVVVPAAPYGALVGIGNGPPTDFEVARDLGARVLLSGEGGNQVTTEPFLIETLVRERRWSAVRDYLAPAGQDAFARTSWRRAMALLRQAKYALLPARIGAWVEDERAASVWRNRPMPPWLGPKLRQVWPDAPPDALSTPQDWASPRQRRLWTQISSPRQDFVCDYLDLSASHYGIEPRLPFRDTSLVRFMLSLPTSLVADLKSPRALHGLAMRDLVPAAVRERNNATVFTAAHLRNATRAFPAIQKVFRGGPWSCGDYVDRQESLALLERLNPTLAGPESWADWTAVREIAALENWMRLM